MILTGDHTRIVSMIDRLNLEAKNLIESAQQISYYSRGAWQYETVLNMSALERDMAVEFINKRLEAAAKMPFPVF
jgi:hypothetical protein